MARLADPYDHYHTVLFQSMCDEINRRVSKSRGANRRNILLTMYQLFDDAALMPTPQQILSVSSPVVRFVMAEVLTHWDPIFAAEFRRQVLHYMQQSFPLE
jgi:hypothetical protein